MRALADVTEDALVRVDQETHAEFGAEADWTPAEVREYLLRLEAARIDPEAAVA
jgi:hypothetical protein